ncbi:hypothetical protein L195_g016076 [Trifolium pratense]|uniref:Uncharacterized protein n=1 Tax=Trifolium pratense TaxID=57577 RepID=A0A2K3MQ42_TRIPR|nr:hypothetical protein L195_g016076 [Trifolium pratense]
MKTRKTASKFNTGCLQLKQMPRPSASNNIIVDSSRQQVLRPISDIIVGPVHHGTEDIKIQLSSCSQKELLRMDQALLTSSMVQRSTLIS